MSSDKWIRSIKDNPAGKVVADDDGNRWQWDDSDETSRLLRQLNNDELAIEQTDIVPGPIPRAGARTNERSRLQRSREATAKGADRGGGFNPYDHSVKPRR
jgi:hypothetical protein